MLQVHDVYHFRWFNSKSKKDKIRLVLSKICSIIIKEIVFKLKPEVIKKKMFFWLIKQIDSKKCMTYKKTLFENLSRIVEN